MVDGDALVETLPAAVAPARTSLWRDALRRFRRHRLALLLLIVYLFRDALKKAVGPEAGVFVLIVVVIGGLRWMPVARLVRAQFLSLREKEFVEAARGLGAPPLRQVVRHILPNAMAPVIVAGSLDVAAAIIAES